MSVDVQDKAGPPSALLNALQTLKDRWWMVAIAMIGGAAIAFAFAVTSTKQYTAESSLLIRQSNLQTLIDPSAAQNSEDPARLAATNLLLVTSTAVAKNVQTALRTNESISDLTSQVSVSANPDADIITIQATDPSPERAARIANAFAVQFVAFERAQSQLQAAAGAVRLRNEIAALPADATAERAQLVQALRSVLALQAVTTGDATAIDTATPPSSPSSPNLKRAPVLGLLAGPRHRSGRRLPDRSVRPPDQVDRGLRVGVRPPGDRQPATAGPSASGHEPRVARILPDPAQRLELPGR